MNQEDRQVQCVEEDTIDLRELWSIILKRKSIVVGIVSVVTVASFIYVWMLRPVTPLYEASALVEVGQSIDEPSRMVMAFDNVYNLKNIMNRVMDISVAIPKKTNALLLLSATNAKEELAKEKLQEGIDFIMQRHKTMAADYTKVRMSQVVGEVKVANVAKQPKKKLIVAVSFMSSLIFALFSAFFLEFIQSSRKEEV